MAVLRYGVTDWRNTFINTGHSDIHVGGWWDWAIRLVVVEAVVLIVWWFIQVAGDGWAANLTLFSTANIGTTVVQWAVILTILLLANRYVVGQAMAADPEGMGGAG